MPLMLCEELSLGKKTDGLSGKRWRMLEMGPNVPILLLLGALLGCWLGLPWWGLLQGDFLLL